MLLVALAAPAFAAEVIEPPVITSEHSPPGVFTHLDASPGVWSPAGADGGVAWLRCGALGDNCTPIDFACSRSYTTTEGDVGNTLRVRLTVVDEGGATATANSAQDRAGKARVCDIPTETPTDTCTELNPTGPRRRSSTPARSPSRSRRRSWCRGGTRSSSSSRSRSCASPAASPAATPRSRLVSVRTRAACGSV